MALTPFALTADNATTSYPDDPSWPGVSGGGLKGQANDRYSSFGSGVIRFPSADTGFNTPTVAFTFLNAYGQKVGGPSVRIKVPTTFNVTNFSDYARTENIFEGGDAATRLMQGALDEKKEGLAGMAQSAGNQVLAAGITGAEAFAYAVKRGVAGVWGFIGSAGLNNANQYEFVRRQAINPMAQMLYKGPQFRRYQLPFSMYPKNASDSSAAKKIVSIFRVASSPSVPDVSGLGLGGETASISIGDGSTFTFGYPHLAQFTVYFRDENGVEKAIFRSKPCVIESVSADYGGQKMTFFGDGSPTEMNLVLQLTEITPRTLGDAKTDAGGTITLG